jgi:hypothetical protein
LPDFVAVIKLRRRVIAERYAAEIAAMYANT